MLEAAGFAEYIFVGGDASLAICYGRAGTDVSLFEKVWLTRAFVEATNLPVLIDSDELGKQGRAYIERAMNEYIRAGAAGWDMDDRDAPEDRTAAETVREAGIRAVYPVEHQVERIKWAVEAKKAAGNPDFLIRTRCFALFAGKSLDETKERIQAYQAAGSDVAYIAGPKNVEEVKELISAVDIPVTCPTAFVSPEIAQEIGLSEARYPYALHHAMNVFSWNFLMDFKERGFEVLKEFNEKYKDHPYMNLSNAPAHGVNRAAKA
jgi:2-methylisocitrate lyase-like PEP mutase family enzyme